MTSMVAEPLVHGSVTSTTSPSVGGLVVQVIDRNVGADITLAETATDARGAYVTRYSREKLTVRRKSQADLQVQVLVDGQVVATSVVRYGAGDEEELDVVIPPTVGLASEHETLHAAIATVFDGSLTDLHESDGRQDITYLANKTGWDARAVAMATTAAKLGGQPDADGTLPADAVPAAFYYALFRAGVPTDGDAVHQIDPQAAVRVWNEAIEAAVIPESLVDALPQATAAFSRLSAAASLQRSSVPGASTLGELLEVSVGDNEKSKQDFAALAVERPGAPFWKAVAERLGADTAERLQLDGKLGFLTLDNAPVIRALHDEHRESPLSDPAQLARNGFHQAGRWTDLLAGAGIPEVVPGATLDEKRENYAQAVAAQLRISYPTATVASMLETGLARLDAPDAVRGNVVAFLDGQAASFEIGREPVQRYVDRMELNEHVGAAEMTQIKRLQRLYQITPDDVALVGLLDAGFHSALDVVRHDRRGFVQTFAEKLGGTHTAELVHAKATQVHYVVANLAMTYSAARSAPTLGMGATSVLLDSTPAGADAPANAGVLAYPTLESLYGSLDYCGCEECRSFLSPAAYLVDLLMFLDTTVPGSANPQQVLLGKRPDIAELPLTCENTNTPLPYIDIVNEVLEYFVVTNPRRQSPESTPTLAGYAGHDTDERISAEELSAEPHFVDDAAYAALQAENYPPPLPFHRALEAIRRHLAALDAPLADTMTALRANDAIERATADGYGWRDILAERLGLSRPQYHLLTSSTVGLAELYGYPSTTTDTDVINDLTGFKRFARRAQLDYGDVVELVRTRFVNPDSVLIPRLERLGVGFDSIKALKDATITDADFTAMLRPGLDPAEYGGDILAWLRNDAMLARIMGLITIVVPAGGDACDVDSLELRYVLPDPDANRLAAVDFTKLARFVRLWRALGWRMSDVDDAVCSLWPTADLPIGNDAASLERLDSGMSAVLPRLGHVAALMSRLHLRVAHDLPSMLALWAPMGVRGATSLFSTLFHQRSGLQDDAAFDEDADGDVLTDTSAKLLDHADAIRAAANVTGAELAAITTSLAYDDTTVLGLSEVSAVYRRAWLARTLRISVTELLGLLGASAVDPFAMPDPPIPGALILLDLLDELRAAEIKPSEALRLVWGRDVSGVRGLEDAALSPFLRSLRLTLLAVNGEFTVADDPQGELARTRMAMVYDTETTAYFFSLIEGTMPFAVHYLAPEAGLPDAVVSASGGRLAYDGLGRRLVHAGPLHEVERDAILALAGLPADLLTAVGQLFSDTVAAQTTLFTSYPELQPLHDAFVASTASLEQKRAALLVQVLPDLVRRRQQQQAVLAASAAASADPTFAPALLDDHEVLRASRDSARPALDDLIAVAQPGATAQFYLRDTATGALDVGPVTVETIAYAPGTGRTLPPAAGGAPISGRWTAWLEPPQAGTYALTVTTDASATVRLALSGADVPLVGVGGSWRNTTPIVLAAGSLNQLELVVEKVTSVVDLRWGTTGVAAQVVPGRYLYPALVVDDARALLQRFLCATTLATHAKLTAAETAHLAKSSTVSGEGWLNAVPSSGPAPAATSASLLAPLRSLCQYAVAKTRCSSDDDRLLQVVKDPAALSASGESLLATVLGWRDEAIAALLDRFSLTRPDLGDVANLTRLRTAMDVVTAVGIDAPTLLRATTNEPTGDTVRILRAALRARSDRTTWLGVLKPINDELRELQRDALVAYVLARLAEDPATARIDTVDKLFEYFLMDVEMQPCTQTSRIRHALLSVQLFVDRCLLNLEPGILPSAVDSKRWSWMKRYRVWEANRKVFLWSENWLEPELRDDASPIFKEVMSELLQGDITDDAAATALGSYLTRLEEVARLEPCGMYVVENSPGVQDDVVHLVARTEGAHRKFFYRSRDHGSWMPWQHVKLDIEDDPIVPCVWQGRLFLFWLRIVKQSQTTASIPGSGSSTNLTSLTRADVGAVAPMVGVAAVLCYSEYVSGTWQPAKTSDVSLPTALTTCRPEQFHRCRIRLATREVSDGLDVQIIGDGYGSSFHLYNTHSAPVRREDIPPSGQLLFFSRPDTRSIDTSTRDLVATYDRGGMLLGFMGTDQELTRNILHTDYNDRAVVPGQPLDEVWDSPFVYSDARHVFYVTTTERQISVAVFQGYGTVDGASTKQINTIPPIVIATKEPPVRDRRGPVERDNPHVFDQGSTERLVREDAYIRTGIGTTAPVSFDGRLIGPLGALGDTARLEQ